MIIRSIDLSDYRSGRTITQLQNFAAWGVDSHGFQYSTKVKALQKRVQAFMDNHVTTSQKRYKDEAAAGDRWQPVAVIEELKNGGTRSCRNFEARRRVTGTRQARRRARSRQRVAWAPEAFSCSAPNRQHQVLARDGTADREDVAGTPVGGASVRRLHDGARRWLQ